MEGAPHRGGFTLLELMIVVAIAALLAGGAAGLSALLESQRRFAALNDLRSLLHFARGQAVTLQKPVRLCALDQERSCTRDWTGRHYAVFIDRNRDQNAAAEESLREGRWSASRGQLQWRAALRRRYVEFWPEGSTGQDGSFHFCDRNATTSLRVVVNRAGRSYVSSEDGKPC